MFSVRFQLLRLRVGLCLMTGKARGVRSCSFFQGASVLSALLFPFFLGFLLKESLQLAVLSVASHCWFTDSVVMWWWDEGGEKVFYNPMIEFQSFSEPVFLVFDPYNKFRDSHQPPQDETLCPGNCPSCRSNKSQSFPLSVGLC